MAESSRIERLPPQNIEAEEAVLGALLIDPDAIIRIAAILRSEDFYREKHGWIYDAIHILHERREPVDFLTVCDELDRRGQLDQVGGAAFITMLINAVPTSIHAEHYSRIVERTATRRRLIEAAGQIAALAYQEADDVEEVVDHAEQILFGVSERRISRELVHIKQVLSEYYDRIEYLTQHRGELIGVPTGFADIDKLLGGLQRSDMVILAARPSVGKTSLALSIAHSASKKHKQRVALFSLEMSSEQVVQRLISAETGIDSQRLRRGEITDEGEWRRFMKATSDLAETYFYIDDSPGISALELRTKARRLHAEVGIDLVIVDYLQLMRGDYRSENRVQEMSAISRAIKSLARELNVPVLALSQLSRGVESRTDKRPILSDLRECLTGDTPIVRADTGERVPIAELAKLGSPVPVWALDEELKLRSVWMDRVFPSGVKPVFKLSTRSGRTIRASGNHPFLRLDGWKRLDEISPGDAIAVPRVLPEAELPQRWPEERLILLAHLIGDGCFVERQSLHYTSQDPACLDVVESAASVFDVTPKRVRQQSTLFKSGISRERMARIARFLPAPEITRLVNSDVCWDQIESIEPDGEEIVYDGTVPGLHNFVAGDIIAHNSGALEQDADVVIFIYRDEMYNENTERKNIADIIIAKQRNGPTGTVALFFKKELAQFREAEMRRMSTDAL